MGLLQVSTNTVSSAVANVTLTGIDSDDVYMVAVSGATVDNPVAEIRARFTVSGTAQTTSNYDWADTFLRASASFIDDSDTNQTKTRALNNTGDSGGEGSNGIFYLYNFNNSSEFSFMTIENVTENGSEARGYQGGTVYTVAETHNGIQFLNDTTGNITNGTFTLYKVV
tara:strand:- start:1757 stop:2263 length:507 start_codon:yes stop_codon:yes gene_type:complete